ncbi:hypothetical protein [Chitinophaga japonensis]|uniref:Uncharacterized protein n=1 Tax=Chitinophaga japonensis TaxID=104662 RepID=A0A562SNZ0_CHIJA|nr:hypothetical protein [Chitinophaga japonensis]TWI82406.1 hypothetical protein LX66_4978 [Chitinophaga japonensis]
MQSRIKELSAKDSAELRNKQQWLLLKNPNYFGIQDKESPLNAQFKPELELLSNTFYEELTCISYKPDAQRLSAIITVKQGAGYSGGPCTPGSKEYVRFYVSYDNGVSWEDEGVVSFDIHDFGNSEDLCYEVFKTFAPRKRSCCDKQPVLPLVRGILSWNQLPPPAAPFWPPIWGNVLEARIQAAPRTGFICLLDDILGNIGVQLDGKQFDLVDQALPPLEYAPALKENYTLAEIAKVYGKEVEPSRKGYSFVSNAFFTKAAVTAQEYELLKKYELDISSIVGALQEQKFNTTYEEVRCVGLNRDFDTLNAAIHIKRSAGYSGNLCSKGSQEYLAYYMDFGGGWVYMGTSSVTVHDIPLPDGGLWYNAPLKVTLDPYQKAWCQTGRAKVKVILSWNWVPPIDPNWVAPWGDWEECQVEIKPLPDGVNPGQLKPFIELLGGMPVDLISGITGEANGLHTLGFTAVESPFGGNTTLRGRFFNQNTHSFRYRIRVIAPSTAEHSVMTQVKLKTDTFGTISPLITLTPDVNGWMPYLANPATNTFIVDDLFGSFTPTERGIHYIRIEFEDITLGGVFYNSQWVKFSADIPAPQVDITITSGGGDCGDFPPGSTISGTYQMTDNDSHSLNIYVTPAAAGTTIQIDGQPTASLAYGSALFPLPNGGKSGTWTLQTTAATQPCGYNIWIHGRDRTIVGSSQYGYHAYMPKGFCLG